MNTSTADTQTEVLSLDRIVELLRDKLVGWFDSTIALLPNLLVAIVVFIIFFSIGSVVSRTCLRAFKRTFDSEAVSSLLAAIIKTLVVAVGFFVALELIGLQKAVVSLLAGAGIIGFPIRTLDFDAKGGIRLAESLQTVMGLAAKQADETRGSG